MGDQKASQYDDSPDNMMGSQEALNTLQTSQNNLPSALTTLGGNILPYEQQLLNAQNTLLPQYNQGMLQLAKAYAPQMNEIYRNISEQNQASQAALDAQIRSGALPNYLETSKLADPEYFQTRQMAANKLSDLLGSYNPTGLSESDAASAERGLNRMNQGMGLGNIPTSTGAISNALNFDDRLQSKKSALSQALSLIPSTLQSFGTQMQGFQNSLNNSSQRSAQQYGQNIYGLNPGQIGQTSKDTMSGMMGLQTEIQKAKISAEADVNSSYNSADDNNARDWMDTAPL